MSEHLSKRDLKAALALLLAAISLLPLSLGVLFFGDLFPNGTLASLGNAIFFLPQHAFPSELTGEHGRVEGIFWVTAAVWIVVAAMFAVATRRLRFRWVVLLALPTVVLSTYAFTTVLDNFGYEAVLEGP